jgi:hypothetical protein
MIKKLSIKSIYKNKKIIDLVFLNFKFSVNTFRAQEKRSAKLAFQEIENLPLEGIN